MSWQAWLTLIFAIWLVVASLIPGIVGSRAANIADFLIVGVIFLITGGTTISKNRTMGWIVLLIGIWLVISACIPGITGSKAGAMTDGLIFGILTLILSFFMKKKE
ncbi:MAG: SPW repeat protein [Thermotogae bacterium]|nr:SPW repeat protein [Thermotogota bacterium]